MIASCEDSTAAATCRRFSSTFFLGDVKNEGDTLYLAVRGHESGNAYQDGDPAAVLAKELFLPRGSNPGSPEMLNRR